MSASLALGRLKMHRRQYPQADASLAFGELRISRRWPLGRMPNVTPIHDLAQHPAAPFVIQKQRAEIAKAVHLHIGNGGTPDFGQ